MAALRRRRQGANGRTGKQWKQLLSLLRIRLADQCNVSPCRPQLADR
ncbi:hypothetical protein Zm00014a_016898 [Zea mays]|uniref:Uncharacterized protein n=1 Tax=Zea mays TaxID=4577 RepID=A0A3L6DHF8_MAIZE|nr:hypothetical protein Zm00014a_016898 [Zea mays]PWZ08045.1 hypothetical protein Zm00014a_016898 [Zea mays]PWZ08046.1 hypothetical protein Zm00014a_016898 [Zea mays]